MPFDMALEGEIAASKSALLRTHMVVLPWMIFKERMRLPTWTLIFFVCPKPHTVSAAMPCFLPRITPSCETVKILLLLLFHAA